MKHGLKVFLAVSFFIIFVEKAYSDEIIRVLTWEGYVLAEEVKEVNKILKEKGYDYKIEVISPYAEGAEQMFSLIRADKCDITFLTLFFIKMQKEKTSQLLLPINTDSPRLTNYRYLLPGMTKIPMGMSEGKPLYIPFGGGAYGFWANMKKLTKSQLPASVKELWKPIWKGKFSLNISQPWYNIGLVLMSSGKSPFYINDLFLAGKREEAIKFGYGEIQKKTTELYRQAGHFWTCSPEFREDLLIVSSWGPEILGENAKGGKWELIRFEEGNMVWLDTINFVNNLSGKKLEAAEIFADYFIGKKVQTRVVNGLSMAAVSSLAESNPLLEQNPNFFSEDKFCPPFNTIADNLMKSISDEAMKEVGVSKNNH